MSPSDKKLLEQVEAWPKEDKAELMEHVREIESRHTGVYILSEDEKEEIEKARKSPLVPDKEMEEFWKRYGVV